MTIYEISGWSFSRDERRLVARETWRELVGQCGIPCAWAAILTVLALLIGPSRGGFCAVPGALLVGLVGIGWGAWRLRVGRRGFVLDRAANRLRSPFNEELSLERIDRFELLVEDPRAGRASFLGRLVALTGDDTGLVLFAANDYAEIDQADTLGRQFAEFLAVPFARRSDPVESPSADRLP